MIFFKFSTVILVVAVSFATATTNGSAGASDYIYVPRLFNPFSWFSVDNNNQVATVSPLGAQVTPTISILHARGARPTTPFVLTAPTRTTRLPYVRSEQLTAITTPDYIFPRGQTPTTSSVSDVFDRKSDDEFAASFNTKIPIVITAKETPPIDSVVEINSLAKTFVTTPYPSTPTTTRSTVTLATTKTSTTEITESTPKPKLNVATVLDSKIIKEVEKYNATLVPVRNHTKPNGRSRYNTTYNIKNLSNNVSQSQLTQTYVLAIDFNTPETSNLLYEIEDNKNSTGTVLESRLNKKNQTSTGPSGSTSNEDNSSILERKDTSSLETRSTDGYYNILSTLGESFVLTLRWLYPWRKT